jgi:hypothetical protein
MRLILLLAQQPMTTGRWLMWLTAFVFLGYLVYLFFRVLADRYRYLLLGVGVAAIFGYWIYQAMHGE